MKRRNGTAPRDADGILWDSCNDDPADALHGWRIYRRAASAAPWLSLKVVSQHARDGAANYWTGWHMDTKRFVNSRATYRMPETMRERIASILSNPDPLAPVNNPAVAADYLREVDGAAPAARAQVDTGGALPECFR